MGLLNAISNWKAERDERHTSEMQSLGKCPDCNGKGFATPMYDFEYVLPYDFPDCPGCNGSGLYSDWEENSQG